MKPFFGANWKMNGSGLEGLAWLQFWKELEDRGSDARVVLFPPFTLLAVLAENAREAGLELGGQDLHPEPSGAFTGEISAGMLVEAGCSWVLVGHSERRHIMGEDDALVARKLAAALGAGLGAVLCVGEKLEEREQGIEEQVVRRQIASALKGLAVQRPGSLVIAYEPVWAIGTGRNASPEEASAMHCFVRGVLDEELGAEAAGGVTVIYGGSVKPSNAAGILAMPCVDGALVGGASLDPAGFHGIVTAWNRG
ncbi:triose-phosphate isomerase [Candidatus Fermentibacteria bacterium]|nr:triose-phosphate isomerase [Candidatus Fermentibacteria bacterium]